MECPLFLDYPFPGAPSTVYTNTVIQEPGKAKLLQPEKYSYYQDSFALLLFCSVWLDLEGIYCHSLPIVPVGLILYFMDFYAPYAGIQCNYLKER